MGRRINANIPVSFSWFLLPFLAFLCLPASAQSIDSICNDLIQFLCKSEAALVCGFLNHKTADMRNEKPLISSESIGVSRNYTVGKKLQHPDMT